MEKEKSSKELVMSVVLVLLALLFLDPLMILMPNSAIYALMAGLVLVFAAFAGLVWRERAEDEREEFHKMLAGRIGYLAGMVVLIFGILYQAFSSHVDAWLVVALVVMIVAKIGGRTWSAKNN